jgi:hypothetical protein
LTMFAHVIADNQEADDWPQQDPADNEGDEFSGGLYDMSEGVPIQAHIAWKCRSPEQDIIENQFQTNVHGSCSVTKPSDRACTWVQLALQDKSRIRLTKGNVTRRVRRADSLEVRDGFASSLVIGRTDPNNTASLWRQPVPHGGGPWVFWQLHK